MRASPLLPVALKWPGFAHSSRPLCHQPLSLSTLWLCVLVAGRVLVVHVCHGHPGRWRRRSRRTVRVLMLLPTRPPSLALTRALALARALQHSNPHSCLLSRCLLLCTRVAALYACGRIAMVACQRQGQKGSTGTEVCEVLLLVCEEEVRPSRCIVCSANEAASSGRGEVMG